MFNSLRAKLVSIALPGLVAAAATLGVSLWSFDVLDRSARETFVTKDVLADILPPPFYLIEMRLVLSQAIEQTLPVAEAVRQVDRLAKEYEERAAYWQGQQLHGLERQLLGEQHQQGRLFIAAAKSQVLDRLKQGDVAGAQTALGSAHALYLAHRVGVQQTVDAATVSANASIERFGSAAARGGWSLWAVVIPLLVAAGVCLRLSLRGFVKELRECAQVADAVASGDLTHSVQARTTDEMGQLRSALDRMSAELAQLVGEVRGACDEIACASNEIAQGNGDLSGRTETQAANLQRTASAMSVMMSHVQLGNEKAGLASDLAKKASAAARESGGAMAGVVKAMSAIESSSSKVTEVVGVIDQIAFQTNILALNAAVESARAGDHGKGFAVVAAEVRRLAQRAAESSRQIRELIQQSVNQVEVGSQSVLNAGRAIQAVVDQVHAVTGFVEEIAESSAHQHDGLAQVNVSIGQLDATTQQNSALVEQTAAASEGLKTQAARMRAAVSTFRIGPPASAES